MSERTISPPPLDGHPYDIGGYDKGTETWMQQTSHMIDALAKHLGKDGSPFAEKTKKMRKGLQRVLPTGRTLDNHMEEDQRLLTLAEDRVTDRVIGLIQHDRLKQTRRLFFRPTHLREEDAFKNYSELLKQLRFYTENKTLSAPCKNLENCLKGIEMFSGSVTEEQARRALLGVCEGAFQTQIGRAHV